MDFEPREIFDSLIINEKRWENNKNGNACSDDGNDDDEKHLKM